MCLLRPPLEVEVGSRQRSLPPPYLSQQRDKRCEDGGGSGLDKWLRVKNPSQLGREVPGPQVSRRPSPIVSPDCVHQTHSNKAKPTNKTVRQPQNMTPQTWRPQSRPQETTLTNTSLKVTPCGVHKTLLTVTDTLANFSNSRKPNPNPQGRLDICVPQTQ